MKQRILALLLALALALALALTGCGGSGAEGDAAASSPPAGTAAEDVPSATQEIFAMDTYMTITCYGEQCDAAAEAAVEEIQRLDALLSTGNAESEVSQLNASGSATLSEDTAAIVAKALEIYNSTDGALDITIYPLMVAWGFTTENYTVPDEETISSLLANVDASRIEFDPETGACTLGEGQQIDLGAIAKGYTSSRLMEIFAEYDLVSGVVSLGGNVQCYGTKPDGTPWRCGIADPSDPENSSKMLGVLELENKAAITSGGYERYFIDEETGVTYHHILDPTTGSSARSGLVSATIVSEDGTLADCLSTSCFIMGLDKASQYWQEHSDEFDMVLMTDDGTVYITEPLEECFTSDDPVEVISLE